MVKITTLFRATLVMIKSKKKKKKEDIKKKEEEEMIISKKKKKEHIKMKKMTWQSFPPVIGQLQPFHIPDDCKHYFHNKHH